MKIKKFESFEESLEDLKSDVEILMQDLIESLNLKILKSDGDPINGFYSYKVVRNGESIVYYFITEDPFDTKPSNSIILKSVLVKVKFIQKLIEAISKVTDRLDKFGYKWELVNYNGDTQLALYVYNKLSN